MEQKILEDQAHTRRSVLRQVLTRAAAEWTKKIDLRTEASGSTTQSALEQENRLFNLEMPRFLDELLRRWEQSREAIMRQPRGQRRFAFNQLVGEMDQRLADQLLPTTYRGNTRLQTFLRFLPRVLCYTTSVCVG